MKMRNMAAVIIILTLVVGGSAFAGINDGLVAYYPFNGNANDESGSGNNGTVHEASLTNDRFSNPNSAYFFDGVNDHIDANNIDLSVITASVWINLKQDYPGTYWAGPIVSEDDISPHRNWILYLQWYQGKSVHRE